MSTRRWLGSFAKVAVSVALFGMLADRFADRTAFVRLAAPDTGLLGLALALTFVFKWLHLLRWQACQRRLGADISQWRALRVLLVGYFFNQALPSSFGGDFVRAWLAHREGMPLHTAFAGMLADRIASLQGLFALCVVLAPVYFPLLGGSSAATIVATAAAMLAVSWIALLVLERIVSFVRRTGQIAHLRLVATDVRKVLFSPRASTWLISLSAAMHMLSCLVFYLVGRALGIDIGFLAVACLFPLVTLAAVFPLSFAGWGVREGAAVAAFTMVGMAPADAFSASVMYGLIMLVASMPGGVVWLFTASRSGLREAGGGEQAASGHRPP